jgi:hypothetical protein
MTFSITKVPLLPRLSYYYVECHNFLIVMLNVIMLSVVMLSVVMLSVIMLSDIMLSVIMLNVIMPNVVAPSLWQYFKCINCSCGAKTFDQMTQVLATVDLLCLPFQ